MELYLFRHADALALGERGITEDADRPLSELGENQCEMVAQGFHKRGFGIDVVVSSPFLRARQTAEILIRHLSPAPREIQFTDTLVPDAAKPRKLTKFLRDLKAKRIVLVGHCPHLPRFIAWLIGGKKAQIDVAKAGMAQISCDEDLAKGQGILQWLVTPEWFA